MLNKNNTLRIKLLTLALVTVFAITMSGCPARKPAPPAETPPPQTVVVPEVSRIFFTEVALNEGPQMARQLVENNQGGEMTVWFESDDQFWVLVQSAQDSDEVLSIEEVLQRVPGRDTMLLEVRLTEEARPQEEQQAGEEQETAEEQQEEAQDGQQQTATAADAMLIRLDINQRPHGIAFLFDSELEEELEEEANVQIQEQPAPRAQQPPAQQQPAPRAQQQENFIQVQEPSPNGEVTSPVQVVGRARVPGATVHVRMKNNQGEVIAESSTTATAAAPQIGNFSATLSYSPPGEGQQGTLEVYSNGRNGEENMVAVPVVIR